ncbi:hypothetical protein, partial [Desulfocurvibacter africanus]|uniref:hypothetical protein n=1 Tax=Desulfocurvibacter africanus TaxID=873 RepID=UPI001EE67513
MRGKVVIPWPGGKLDRNKKAGTALARRNQRRHGGLVISRVLLYSFHGTWAGRLEHFAFENALQAMHRHGLP